MYGVPRGPACILERLPQAFARFVPHFSFPATSEREKISFHQLNKETGNRIRYRKVDSETGDEVEQADIIKGYEVTKGEYIEIDPEELEAVAIESKRTIEIEEFVPKTEIDELYMRDPITSCRTARSASRRLPSSAKRSARKAWSRSEKSSLRRANTSSHWKRATKD